MKYPNYYEQVHIDKLLLIFSIFAALINVVLFNMLISCP